MLQQNGTTVTAIVVNETWPVHNGFLDIATQVSELIMMLVNQTSQMEVNVTTIANITITNTTVQFQYQTVGCVTEHNCGLISSLLFLSESGNVSDSNNTHPSCPVQVECNITAIRNATGDVNIQVTTANATLLNTSLLQSAQNDNITLSSGSIIFTVNRENGSIMLSAMDNLCLYCSAQALIVNTTQADSNNGSTCPEPVICNVTAIRNANGSIAIQVTTDNTTLLNTSLLAVAMSYNSTSPANSSLALTLTNAENGSVLLSAMDNLCLYCSAQALIVNTTQADSSNGSTCPEPVICNVTAIRNANGSIAIQVTTANTTLLNTYLLAATMSYNSTSPANSSLALTLTDAENGSVLLSAMDNLCLYCSAQALIVNTTQADSSNGSTCPEPVICNVTAIRNASGSIAIQVTTANTTLLNTSLLAAAMSYNSTSPANSLLTLTLTDAENGSVLLSAMDNLCLYCSAQALIVNTTQADSSNGSTCPEPVICNVTAIRNANGSIAIQVTTDNTTLLNTSLLAAAMSYNSTSPANSSLALTLTNAENGSVLLSAMDNLCLYCSAQALIVNTTQADSSNGSTCPEPVICNVTAIRNANGSIAIQVTTDNTTLLNTSLLAAAMSYNSTSPANSSLALTLTNAENGSVLLSAMDNLCLYCSAQALIVNTTQADSSNGSTCPEPVICNVTAIRNASGSIAIQVTTANTTLLNTSLLAAAMSYNSTGPANSSLALTLTNAENGSVLLSAMDNLCLYCSAQALIVNTTQADSSNGSTCPEPVICNVTAIRNASGSIAIQVTTANTTVLNTSLLAAAMSYNSTGPANSSLALTLTNAENGSVLLSAMDNLCLYCSAQALIVNTTQADSSNGSTCPEPVICNVTAIRNASGGIAIQVTAGDAILLNTSLLESALSNSNSTFAVNSSLQLTLASSSGSVSLYAMDNQCPYCSAQAVITNATQPGSGNHSTCPQPTICNMTAIRNASGGLAIQVTAGDAILLNTSLLESALSNSNSTFAVNSSLQLTLASSSGSVSLYAMDNQCPYCSAQAVITNATQPGSSNHSTCPQPTICNVTAIRNASGGLTVQVTAGDAILLNTSLLESALSNSNSTFAVNSSLQLTLASSSGSVSLYAMDNQCPYCSAQAVITNATQPGSGNHSTCPQPTICNVTAIRNTSGGLAVQVTAGDAILLNTSLLESALSNSNSTFAVNSSLQLTLASSSGSVSLYAMDNQCPYCSAQAVITNATQPGSGNHSTCPQPTICNVTAIRNASGGLAVQVTAGDAILLNSSLLESALSNSNSTFAVNSSLQLTLASSSGSVSLYAMDNQCPYCSAQAVITNATQPGSGNHSTCPQPTICNVTAIRNASGGLAVQVTAGDAILLNTSLLESALSNSNSTFAVNSSLQLTLASSSGSVSLYAMDNQCPYCSAQAVITNATQPGSGNHSTCPQPTICNVTAIRNASGGLAVQVTAGDAILLNTSLLESALSNSNSTFAVNSSLQLTLASSSGSVSLYAMDNQCPYCSAQAVITNATQPGSGNHSTCPQPTICNVTAIRNASGGLAVQVTAGDAILLNTSLLESALSNSNSTFAVNSSLQLTLASSSGSVSLYAMDNQCPYCSAQAVITNATQPGSGNHSTCPQPTICNVTAIRNASGGLAVQVTAGDAILLNTSLLESALSNSNSTFAVNSSLQLTLASSSGSVSLYAMDNQCPYCSAQAVITNATQPGSGNHSTCPQPTICNVTAIRNASGGLAIQVTAGDAILLNTSLLESALSNSNSTFAVNSSLQLTLASSSGSVSLYAMDNQCPYCSAQAVITNATQPGSGNHSTCPQPTICNVTAIRNASGGLAVQVTAGDAILLNTSLLESALSNSNSTFAVNSSLQLTLASSSGSVSLYAMDNQCPYCSAQAVITNATQPGSGNHSTCPQPTICNVTAIRNTSGGLAVQVTAGDAILLNTSLLESALSNNNSTFAVNSSLQLSLTSANGFVVLLAMNNMCPYCSTQAYISNATGTRSGNENASFSCPAVVTCNMTATRNGPGSVAIEVTTPHSTLLNTSLLESLLYNGTTVSLNNSLQLSITGSSYMILLFATENGCSFCNATALIINSTQSGSANNSNSSTSTGTTCPALVFCNITALRNATGSIAVQVLTENMTLLNGSLSEASLFGNGTMFQDENNRSIILKKVNEMMQLVVIGNLCPYCSSQALIINTTCQCNRMQQCYGTCEPIATTVINANTVKIEFDALSSQVKYQVLFCNGKMVLNDVLM